MFAGIAGRAYQTPDPIAGLNLYIMAVAPTGKGKDAGKTGIDRLNSAVVRGNATSGFSEFVAAKGFIGPGSFASEAGLMRSFDRSLSFVSCIGESGKC